MPGAVTRTEPLALPWRISTYLSQQLCCACVCPRYHMQAQRRQILPSPNGDAHANDVHSDLWHDSDAFRVSVPRPASEQPTLHQNTGPQALPVKNRRQRLPRPATGSIKGRNPVLWGVLGFALGVAFWHAIGFWGFVSAVVLPQAAERDTQNQRQAEPRDTVTVPPRTVSHARPTRSIQQQQQIVAGKPAAATAPPRSDDPQPQMPLPGWGTTVKLAEDPAAR